jgi:hypothetical protein
MGNPFVHVELMSTDVDKAKSFYGKLFDWKLEDMDMGDMTYTQGGRGDWRRAHEESDPKLAFDVGRVCQRRRCESGDGEG